MLDPDLFEAAQRAREANQTNPAKVNRRHRRYSLSGLAVCERCGKSLHFHTSKGGRPRVYCYQARQVSGCGQRSVFLDGIDDQIAAYLGTFRFPDEMVDRIVALQRQSRDDQDESARKQKDLEARLERLKRMFEWGDLTEAAYLADRQHLRAELASLTTTTDWTAVLEQAANFLRNLPTAWEAASSEQRNALARIVLQSVEILGGQVVAVVPQPDFAPFFNLGEMETQERENDHGQPVLAAHDRQASTLAGGSDGGRFSTFKTYSVQADPSVFRSPTSGLLRLTPRDGRPARGVTTPLPAATPVVLAS